ncbi:MAG: PepSY-associated TM helix domain-containing protein [Pseudomonadota bacterium]
MANREKHVRIYDLHSWTGIALGLMVFVVCFTGSLALFHDEFHVWEDPTHRIEATDNPVPIHDLFSEWIDENKGYKTPQFASISPAHDGRGYYEGFVSLKDSEGEFEQLVQKWDAKTGARLPAREDGANRFLYDLHRDLAWPEILGGRQIGRALVGVVGIAFMLIILSGVIAHTKIVKELFSLRYLRSVRLKWQDTHKVLGLWGLPFSSMIAFTGAWLGVITLLLPLLAAVTVAGDVDKLANALGLEQQEAAGVAVEMLPFDVPLNTRHPETGALPQRVFATNWGDNNATYTMNYPVDDRLVFSDQLRISAVDGSDIPITDRIAADEPLPRMLGAISPLHYGTFGGVALKLVYFAMGMMLAIMAALGNMMWIERRLHGGEGHKSEKFYRRLSAFTTGVCAGLPVASFGVLLLDALYWGSEPARFNIAVMSFFAIWLATLGFAFVRKNDYRATREMLGLSGVVLLAMPIVNGLTTGDYFWTALGSSASVAGWFDISFIILGGLTLATANKLPRNRPVDKRRRAQGSESAPGFDSELQPAE